MSAPKRTPQIASCIGCGCHDNHACLTDRGPCHWLRVDYRKGQGVCSACQQYIASWDVGDREPRAKIDPEAEHRDTEWRNAMGIAR
ncbi:MAG: hypothetical protein ABI790_05295 [Betaproteobacteria bacterium]